MRRFGVAFAAALLLASVGTSRAAATLQNIVDGARQEGQLSIVAGDSILGGANERLIEAFNITV